MNDHDHDVPSATVTACLIAAAGCFLVLALLMVANDRLFGNAWVSRRQLIAAAVALGIGSLLAIQAAEMRRWRRCKVWVALAVGLAVAGWWLVPGPDGNSQMRLYQRANHQLSKLRVLPPGEFDQFRTEMDRRDRLVKVLPRVGRSIRAEEQRWLTESLTGAISAAEPRLASDPARFLMDLKAALRDLPGPEKYMPDASPSQRGFLDAWRRAKIYRLEAVKSLVLPRITARDYRAAAGIAATLQNDARADLYRDAELDTATERFIDAVKYLDSLNDLSRGPTRAGP